MAEFFSQRDVKLTKKTHHCEGCGKFIDAGSSAYYFALKDDGQFYAGYYHTDCRKAETEWNDICGYWSDEYEALWSICDGDDWDDFKPWVKENYPAVAGRLCLSKPKKTS